MWIWLIIDTICICIYMNDTYICYIKLAPALSCDYALYYLFIITVFLCFFCQYIYSFASTYGLLAYYAYIRY